MQGIRRIVLSVFFLEGEMHEILEENIASGSPYSVYDNAALCEALKETLEDGEWIAETCDSFLWQSILCLILMVMERRTTLFL